MCASEVSKVSVGLSYLLGRDHLLSVIEDVNFP